MNRLKPQFEELIKNLEPKSPNEFLTISQAAEILSVDKSTIFNWRCNGVIRCVGLGSRVYVMRSEIDRRMAEL